MNSVWLTSPFVKFNTDNLIYNETLCSEAHFLNKFARDKYKTDDQNSSMSNERQGNFTIASNYSSQSNLHSQGEAQDEDVEENCTITVNGNFHIKIDSKVSLKKSESRRTLSETNLRSENVTRSSNVVDEAVDKIGEIDIQTELSGSNRTKSINYVSNKKKSQLSANDVKEDQIGNALLICPFELVQIYPGNKENISDLGRTFSDISRQESSMISFPKEDNKSSKTRIFENDAPPTKCGQVDRACEEHRLMQSPSNSQCHNVSKTVEDATNKSETVKLNIVRDIDSSTCSDDSEKSCSTGKKKKRSSKERSRKVLKRSEKLMNYLDHAKMDCNFVDDSDTSRSRKACTEYDKSMPLVCESEKVLIEDLFGMEEHRKDKVIASLLNEDVCNNDMVDKYPNKSNENNVTKSRCDLSSVTNISDNNLLKRNDTVIKTKKRKLGSKSESVDLKESLEIVNEKRKKEQNISNTIEMARVNDKQNGGNRSSERKMTEYAIDDDSNGMIEMNAKFSVDYRDIKICNLLSKIREQLYINFQKMESIWIQLQDTSPIDSVRSTMPLRILVRIISRCKSYIHDSHDSCKAESMIAENLFNLVIELAKSVDQNKLVLENQERQIDSLLLKLYQEKSLYKKRIMMNEVVSFWDHGLREISDIIQDISDKLKTVITEGEEKENVRNSSFRRKDGAVESKGPKVNLMRKKSSIETQMSVALNKPNTINPPKSKMPMKVTNTQKYQDVEKLSYEERRKIVESKMNDVIILNRYNATRHPKSKTSTKSLNIQRYQDVEKLSYNEPLRIVESKMNDVIILNRYNATKHQKSKTSTKSLNIQRHQDLEKLSYNEPLRIAERKMNDNISLNRYNATKHPKYKTSTKSLNIQRCQEVEKLSFNEPVKFVERKINDIVRYAEKGKPLKKPTQSVNFEQSRLPLSRQKYRAANNPQPVWRPGGVVKLPSSSSATTLTQKNRTLFASANERANQLTDNMKEGKHGRSGDSKKYRIPSLTIDSFKHSSRKYTMNLEATSKVKPKSRPLKVCFKDDNGSSGRSESPSSEKTLPERVNRQNNTKEAKVLKLLEEIIKSTPADKKDKRTTNKSMGVNYETRSMDLERSTKPISIEEEMEIPQDEPTRDIDPNQVVQSRSEDTFDKTDQHIEKIPERPPIMIPPTHFASSSVIKDQTMDSKSCVNFENSQLKNNCNFTCPINAKRTTEQHIEKIPEHPPIIPPTHFASSSVIKDQTMASKSSVHLENSQLKNNCNFTCTTNAKHTTEQDIEKIPEHPPIIIPPTDSASSSVMKDQTMAPKSSVHLENSQLKNNCNFTCTTDAKHTTEQDIEKIPEHSPIIIPPTEFASSSVIKAKAIDSQSSVHLENSQLKNNCNFTCLINAKHTTEQDIEKIPEHPPIIIPPTEFASSSVIKAKAKDSKLRANLENSQLKNNCNFACTTNAKYTTESKHSYTDKIKTSNSQQTCASCVSQKRQKNELNTSRDSMRVKEERYKNTSSVNVCTNSHTTSLTILKEFLRDQGVDVDLLNRAEQCVRDKRKCRGCLKTKSVSLADVMTFTQQRVEHSENATDNSYCQGDMLKEIVQSCERNSADLKVAMKSFDQNCKDILKLSAPEKKDTSTCTETDNKDSSVQTSLRETKTKGIQIIIEEDIASETKQQKETIETQTEMISIKHTATDCCRDIMECAVKIAGQSNSVNSSSMTESTSVRDSTTETVQVFSAAEMTDTELPRSNLNKEIDDHYDENAANFIEIWNEMFSKNLCLCDDRDLTRERHLNRLNEVSSDKALVRLQNGGGCELGFRESDTSTSSYCSQFSESSKHSNCCAMLDPKLNNFNRVISTETIATLQSAAIKARNMYRAIFIYQQHMENKLKEEEEKTKFENTENSEKSENQSTVDSIDIIVKDSYHSCEYDVEILSRAEIASLSDESEYEMSKSVSMLSTTVLYNERGVSGDDGLKIGKKSSSSAVLDVVKSLMDVLIQKIDDVKVTQIDCVQKVSSRTCSKIHIEFLKVDNEKNEFSMSPFSRQNLLMLVYGVVCSIVFWSLHFTITCDVVT